MKDQKIKTCFHCKKEKPISEMTDMGVWVCKECYNPKDSKDGKGKKGK